MDLEYEFDDCKYTYEVKYERFIDALREIVKDDMRKNGITAEEADKMLDYISCYYGLEDVFYDRFQDEILEHFASEAEDECRSTPSYEEECADWNRDWLRGQY